MSIRLRREPGESKHASNISTKTIRKWLSPWSELRERVKVLFTGVGSTIRNAPLANYWNLLYLGPIYMGDNHEELDIVWDTGSSVYLAKTHTTCPECEPASVYDYAAEIGGSFSWGEGGEYKQTYLDGTQISGDWAQDKVCVLSNNSTCVDNFNWVAIRGH